MWQINPRNPHAHTNLIRTPEGDLKIIDLESALAIPIPAPGQWRSSLKSGYFPIFDDIHFPLLRQYISSNKPELEASLGTEGTAELDEAVAQAEATMIRWKEAEPRIWGRLSRRAYRLMDWSGALRSLRRAMEGADKAGETFLNHGIERWEMEGRLTNAEAEMLRAELRSSEVREAMHHLGVHLVLSVFLRFPLGSIGRFAWTLVFWSTIQIKGLPIRAGRSTRGAANVHSPLVMAISLVPGFGAIAYLAARPLRNMLLIRLMMDQTASKLPFRLYSRLRLSRWLTPVRTGNERQSLFNSDLGLEENYVQHKH